VNVAETPEVQCKSFEHRWQEAGGCDCDVSDAGAQALRNLSDEQAEYR
jgi:hypothetical protein